MLLDARERAGLTQRELATVLRVSKTAIQRIEQGDRRIDLAELFVWSKALNTTPETVIRRIRRHLDK